MAPTKLEMRMWSRLGCVDMLEPVTTLIVILPQTKSGICSLYIAVVAKLKEDDEASERKWKESSSRFRQLFRDAITLLGPQRFVGKDNYGLSPEVSLGPKSQVKGNLRGKVFSYTLLTKGIESLSCQKFVRSLAHSLRSIACARHFEIPCPSRGILRNVLLIWNWSLNVLIIAANVCLCTLFCSTLSNPAHPLNCIFIL